jgi:hypothetical protein
MSDTQKYFFLHLHKTAGTTLWVRMHNTFEDHEFYPDPTDGGPPNATLVVENLVERWQARSSEIRVVTGHFPLCTTKLLGAQFRTFTLLREPVARTLSALRHHRASLPDPAPDLEEIYDDPMRQLMIRNHMVKMLSLRVDEMTAGTLTSVDFTDAHLAGAKEALSTIDVVGVQTRFEAFCDALTQRFGWDLGAPMVANSTRPAEVSDRLRQRIIDDNALDIELYEFGQQLAV